MTVLQPKQFAREDLHDGGFTTYTSASWGDFVLKPPINLCPGFPILPIFEFGLSNFVLPTLRKRRISARQLSQSFDTVTVGKVVEFLS